MAAEAECLGCFDTGTGLRAGEATTELERGGATKTDPTTEGSLGNQTGVDV